MIRRFLLRARSLLGGLFRHPRYQVMAVMVVVALVLGDRVFPFSHFPMYSSFSDRTHYVYLADETGAPLPLFDVFGYRTTRVKKIYSNEMREIYRSLMEAPRGDDEEEVELHTMTDEQLRPAGDATLRWLVENDRRSKQRKGAPVPPLRLYHVDVDRGPDGRLRRTARWVGSHPGGES